MGREIFQEGNCQECEKKTVIHVQISLMFLVNAEMHLMSEKKAKRRLKDEEAKLTDFE
jgi:hypothetical protein